MCIALFFPKQYTEHTLSLNRQQKAEMFEWAKESQKSFLWKRWITSLKVIKEVLYYSIYF